MKKISLFLTVMLTIAVFCACAPNFDDNPEAMNAASKSVLTIEVYDKLETVIATGSGFVIMEDSIVATNFHVIEGAYSIKVVDGDGGVSIVKQIVAYDQKNDIALLEIVSGKGYKPLSANRKEVVKGEKVVAIGSPLGITNTFSTGIVSGYMEADGVEYIQFTAPISHGSSGGALFNQDGNVIGMTSGFYEAGQNMNVAIPIDRIVSLYDSKPSQAIVLEEFYDLYKKDTLPEKCTVGVRRIFTTDQYTAEFYFALFKRAKNEKEIIKYIGDKLYKVTPGMWDKKCDQWCFDQSRESGDCVLIETTNGYAVLYFVGTIE